MEEEDDEEEEKYNPINNNNNNNNSKTRKVQQPDEDEDMINVNGGTAASRAARMAARGKDIKNEPTSPAKKAPIKKEEKTPTKAAVPVKKPASNEEELGGRPSKRMKVDHEEQVS